MNGFRVLGLWTAAAAAIALIAGWNEVLCWTNQNAGLASWVQAIGSIIAIVATGWAVHWAHTLSASSATKKEADDEVRKLSAVASCIFHCRAQTESLKRYCAYLPSVDREVEPLRRQGQLLQSINLLDIPDWRAAVAVGQTIAMYSYLAERLTNKQDTDEIGAFQKAVMDKRVKHCEGAIAKFEECERIVQETLKDRGKDVPQQQMQFADGVVQSISVR